MHDFSNKVAVVAGAGGGMGLQIAQDLIGAGARVAMLDIKPKPEGISINQHTAYFETDISDPTAVNDVISQVHSQFGRIDMLANVAGVLWFGKDMSALNIDLDVWDRVMNINLKGYVHLTRAVVPVMKQQGGGAMVHFSTTQCLRGDSAPQDAYQAAKAGVMAYSKSLAIQLAGDGIRSNVVVPGPCESPMQDRWKSNPEGKEATARVIPLGRVGQVTDMANACLFLLSDNASFITGTELLVDGGLLARP